MRLLSAGQSHEQLLFLRQTVKDSGAGVQGHSRTPADNARALLQVHQLQQHDFSFDAAVKTVAKAELASPTTLRAAHKRFTFTGSLEKPEDRRSHPDHPFYRDSGPSLEAQLLIHRELHDVKLNNVFGSCTTLCIEGWTSIKAQVNSECAIAMRCSAMLIRVLCLVFFAVN
jgi:hypothetical protein